MEKDKNSFVFHDLVLVGGGHAHVHVLKMWGMQPMPNVRVTLVTRDLATPYSGMIPGFIAGKYSKEECHLDLFRICVFANVKLIHAEVSRIDCNKKLIYCGDGRPPLRYDTLSVDVGIVPSIASLDLAKHPHITPVKPIDKFATRWEAFLKRVSDEYHPSKSSAADDSKAIKVLVAGGGAGGIEVAFGIEQRVRTLGVSVEVTVINRSETVMSSHGKAVQDIIVQTLNIRQIKVLDNTEIVKALTKEEIIIRQLDPNRHWLEATDGRVFDFDEAFWCTQAVAHPWIRGSGLELSEDGFILVNPTLESINRAGVFAVGDCCHNVKHPRPKAGVFAVRAGPPLLQNIRKHIQQRFPLDEWEPQTEFLGIIGTGNNSAVATKGGMALQGEFLWKLKDKIDRIWMSQYQNLPVMDMSKPKSPGSEMAGPPLSFSDQSLLDKAKMRCAGCGSKVGSTILNRVIKRLQKHMRQNPSNILPVLSGSGSYSISERVMAGIGDDAAVLQWPVTGTPLSKSMVMVQTIDYFKSFVGDPYLFGRIAANHALSDLHAMLARPYSALALCSVPYGAEFVTEDDLLHMLAGARQELDKEDCALVGGHTTEGAEHALGFALTGYVQPEVMNDSTTSSSLSVGILYKGPVIPGQVIILTKALGAGVLLAAAMPNRNFVSCYEISSCYESMVQSNMVAAKIVAQFGCSACTDVTGFGFMGHLVEMIRHQRLEKSSSDEETEGYDNESDDEDNGNSCRLLTRADKDKLEKLPVVRLFLSQLPILPGAVRCSVEHNVSSSLFGANHRSAQQIINLEDSKVTSHPSFALLFDPQTSGGLLTCVPRDKADIVISTLKEAGYGTSSVVGEVMDDEEISSLVKSNLNGVSTSRADLNGCVFVEA